MISNEINNSNLEIYPKISVYNCNNRNIARSVASWNTWVIGYIYIYIYIVAVIATDNYRNCKYRYWKS